MTTDTKETLIATLLSVGIFIGALAISYFITTCLAMILAGAIGHTANNDWLRHLSFWQCSPAWIVVIIMRAIFK